MTNTKLYANRERAKAERDRYTSALKELRENADLSDHGRQRRIADLWRNTRDKLDKLKAEEQETFQARWTQLERDVFGGASARLGGDPATHAISARDASERAGQIDKPEEASAMLRRAEADRDELLARAVARRSMDMAENVGIRSQAAAWEDVFGEFLSSRPSLEGAVGELAEIETLTKRQILNEYSLPQPTDVTSPSFFNNAGETAEAS